MLQLVIFARPKRVFQQAPDPRSPLPAELGRRTQKTRDNKAMYVARAFAQQAQLDEAINDLKPTLGPDVVRLKYTLGQDWSGESAIFFKIVLSDRASRRDQLRSATNQITNAIEQRLQPLEQWGVLPYFSFRSQSEQAVLQEEAWA